MAAAAFLWTAAVFYEQIIKYFKYLLNDSNKQLTAWQYNCIFNIVIITYYHFHEFH